MEQYEEKEMSLKDLILQIKEYYNYLLSKWKLIVIVGFLGAFFGLLKSIMTPIQYEAKLSFSLLQEQKKGGGLLNLASSLGFGGSTGEANVFSSGNFFEILKSRNLVEKTLLEPYDEKRKISFAQKYAEIYELDKVWAEDENPEVQKIKFVYGEPRERFSRTKDSVLGKIYQDVVENKLQTELPTDKESSIMKIKVTSQEETFSKKFSERLLDVSSEYYIKLQTAKIQKNVDLLQRQADSVRNELNASLSGVAVANDNVFGLNPAMNVQRIPSARRQVDVQANTTVFAELTKSLELTKMELLNTKPLFQIVDKPIYPLEMVRLGKLKAMVIGGFLAGFLIVGCLVGRLYVRKQMEE